MGSYGRYRMYSVKNVPECSNVPNSVIYFTGDYLCALWSMQLNSVSSFETSPMEGCLFQA